MRDDRVSIVVGPLMTTAGRDGGDRTEGKVAFACNAYERCLSRRRSSCGLRLCRCRLRPPVSWHNCCLASCGVWTFSPVALADKLTGNVERIQSLGLTEMRLMHQSCNGAG